MRKFLIMGLVFSLILAMTVTSVRADEDVSVAFSLKYSYSNLGKGWSPTISVFFPTEITYDEEFGIRLELRGTLYSYGKEIVMENEYVVKRNFPSSSSSYGYRTHTEIGNEFGLKVGFGSYLSRAYVFFSLETSFGKAKSVTKRYEDGLRDGEMAGKGKTVHWMFGAGTDFGFCLNKHLHIGGELFGGTSFMFPVTGRDTFFFRPWYYRTSLGIKAVF